jgi:hypothetical protein
MLETGNMHLNQISTALNCEVRSELRLETLLCSRVSNKYVIAQLFVLGYPGLVRLGEISPQYAAIRSGQKVPCCHARPRLLWTPVV